MKNYTNRLVDFAVGLKYADLSPEVIEQTRMFIADYFAACLAGLRINKDFNQAVLDVLVDELGAEQATVMFEKRKFPVAGAAFLNAAYAHGADMDDGNRKSAGHIGTHVMAVAFAVSEMICARWKDVFVAINIGYEFFNRIAGAAQPSLYNKGFHSTGLAGTMACAAVTAKLLELDKKRFYNSVSLAAIQSSGLIIIDESGQGCKPINSANAARIGVTSAFIASKGVESSKNPLESQKGWFRAFSDDVNEKILLDDLGKKFTICESYLKLYPTCRHTHSCIDAAKEIRLKMMETDVGIERIDQLKLYIYPSAIKSAGKITEPKTSDEAKFSIAYAIAVAIADGDFSLENLSRIDNSEAIHRLESLLEINEDASMEDRKKGTRGCRMQVVIDNGEMYESIIPIPKGEGIGSLSWEDIITKTLKCSEGLVKQDRVITAIGKIRKINLEDRFNPLYQYYEN